MLDLASAGITSFTCAGLTPNTRYHLRVVAFSANGEASPTNAVQATTNPSPLAPNPVSGVSSATTVVTVTWTDTNQNETGYQVEHSINGGTSFTLRGTTGANATSFADYGLTPGSTYHYRVRAFDGPVSGPYSSVVEVATTVPISSVIVDNADATGVSITGTWTLTNSTSAYAGNYLHDGNGGKGQRKVLYTATLPSPGIYEAHARWVGSTSRSPSVPITVRHRDGSSEVRVDQRSQGGSWYFLGRFSYETDTPATILIDNTGTSGTVEADAVQFSKVADLPSGGLTLLQDWKLRYLGDSDAPDQGDPDNDGIPNILEYALAGDPMKPDPGILPKVETKPGNRLAYMFSRPDPSDVKYEVWASSDLSNWQVVASRPAGGTAWSGSFNVSETTGSPDVSVVRAEDPLTFEQTTWRFLRLEVTKPN